MTIYVFDGTMDGLLSAVFDAFFLKEEPEQLLTGGDVLPLFCDRIYQVTTDGEKARRVWAGLEKQLPKEALRMISTCQLSELQELWQPLFKVVCKVFRQGPGVMRNYADADVLSVTQIARRVIHELEGDEGSQHLEEAEEDEAAQARAESFVAAESGNDGGCDVVQAL